MATNGQTYPAALDHLSRVDPGSDDWERELAAATMGVVDTILRADASGLEHLTDPLRDRLADLFEDRGHTREVRGWLLALLSVTRLALQRLPSADELELPSSGQAWNFLKALEQYPRNSAFVKAQLDTGDSQVSRVGRDLLARGLVIQRRLGREASWELTPRGRQLLRAAHAPGQAAARAAVVAAQVSPGTAKKSLQTKVPTGAGSAASRAAGAGGRAARSADASAKRGVRASAELSASGSARVTVAKDGEVRHVLPSPRGGWRVAKSPSGRTIRQADTKAEAVKRARAIVAKAGGGEVTTYSRIGEEQSSITVEPEGGS